MFNSDLIDDIARERAVPFLGAGVSAAATTAAGTQLPDWESFLDIARAKVAIEVSKQVRSLLDDKDYLLACQLLQDSLQEEWEGLVKSEFGQKATPSPLHLSIVKLHQRIILTTNFDKLIESAWDILDKDATHYPTVTSRLDEKAFKALKDHSGRYIIKIHGTVDNADSLIFSRSDYIRLAFGNANYSGFIENLLLNYTFIFIGFSMNDPAITSLMEMYALRYPGARPHYIFSKEIPDNISTINKRLRKLIHIPFNKYSDLPDMLEKIGEAAAKRRREIFASSVA